MRKSLSAFGLAALFTTLVSAGSLSAQDAASAAWPLPGTPYIGQFGYFTMQKEPGQGWEKRLPIVAIGRYEFRLDGAEQTNAGLDPSPTTCRLIEIEYLKREDWLLRSISFNLIKRELPDYLTPAPFPRQVAEALTKPRNDRVTVELGGTASRHIRCFYSRDKEGGRPLAVTVYGAYLR